VFHPGHANGTAVQSRRTLSLCKVDTVSILYQHDYILIWRMPVRIRRTAVYNLSIQYYTLVIFTLRSGPPALIGRVVGHAI
jgi:hypothetical protein